MKKIILVFVLIAFLTGCKSKTNNAQLSLSGGELVNLKMFEEDFLMNFPLLLSHKISKANVVGMNGENIPFDNIRIDIETADLKIDGKYLYYIVFKYDKKEELENDFTLDSLDLIIDKQTLNYNLNKFVLLSAKENNGSDFMIFKSTPVTIPFSLDEYLLILKPNENLIDVNFKFSNDIEISQILINGDLQKGQINFNKEEEYSVNITFNRITDSYITSDLIINYKYGDAIYQTTPYTFFTTYDDEDTELLYR